MAIRFCTNCKQPFQEGYYVEHNVEYFCSDDCLHTRYTPEEWEEIYAEGESDSYYTEWHQVEPYYSFTDVYELNGQLYLYPQENGSHAMLALIPDEFEKSLFEHVESVGNTHYYRYTHNPVEIPREYLHNSLEALKDAYERLEEV